MRSPVSQDERFSLRAWLPARCLSAPTVGTFDVSLFPTTFMFRPEQQKLWRKIQLHKVCGGERERGRRIRSHSCRRARRRVNFSFLVLPFTAFLFRDKRRGGLSEYSAHFHYRDNVQASDLNFSLGIPNAAPPTRVGKNLHSPTDFVSWFSCETLRGGRTTTRRLALTHFWLIGRTAGLSLQNIKLGNAFLWQRKRWMFYVEVTLIDQQLQPAAAPKKQFLWIRSRGAV